MNANIGPLVSYRNTENLLERDMQSIVNWLGSNNIYASENSQKKIYSVFLENDNEKINRVISCSKEKNKLPLSFSINWTPDGVTFKVFIPKKISQDDCIQIHINGTTFCDWIYRDFDNQENWGDADVTLFCNEDRYNVHVYFQGKFVIRKRKTIICNYWCNKQKCQRRYYEHGTSPDY